jgi:hypothetical protein
MAGLNSEIPHKEPMGKAFLVGQYFHTAMEGNRAHDDFIREHWNVIYKSGDHGKYADFEQADRMIEAARHEEVFAKLIRMEGENEKIMTGLLFDEIPWKVRFDKYINIPDRYIIDWKTAADLNEKVWDEKRGEKVSFIRAYGYDIRAAVYMEIEKQNAGEDTDPFFALCCVSKQTPPDKEFILMNAREEMAGALAAVQGNALRFWRVKQGLEKPKGCGRCGYCRSVKKITGPKLFTEFDPVYGEEV